jgi:hypothetical protein
MIIPPNCFDKRRFERFSRFINNIQKYEDRLCGLMVRVLDYRFGGPGSIPGKSSGLEPGPLSLVSTTEELLDRKVAAHV